MPAFLTDPEIPAADLRRRIYSGDLVILTRLRTLAEFVDYMRDELARLFAPHDPEHAHGGAHGPSTQPHRHGHGSLGGRLASIGFGDALLILAFTLVGSAIQLPGVGGGSQVACFLAYTAIFGVENEPAAAAAILIWLVTFAGVGVVGVPLLIHEGMSLGELKRLAEGEKQREEQQLESGNA